MNGRRLHKELDATNAGGGGRGKCKPSELKAKVFPNSPRKFSLWIYLTIRSHKALVCLCPSPSLPFPLSLPLAAGLNPIESEKGLHNNNEMLALKYSSYATLYKLHML